MKIRAATAEDAPAIAAMVGALLGEIMDAIGVQVFNFDLATTISRLQDFIGRGKYFAYEREGFAITGGRELKLAL